MKAYLFLPFLLLLLLLPASASAAGICQFDSKKISPHLRAESNRIEALSSGLDRWREAELAPKIERRLAGQMLRSAWRAFGYKGTPLQRRVAANMRQIALDSGFRPHIDGSLPGQTDIYYFFDEEGVFRGGPPGGLFALKIDDYYQWRDYPGWRGSEQKFNPLSNIIAAVGYQVETKKLLSGKKYTAPLGKREGTFCASQKR